MLMEKKEHETPVQHAGAAGRDGIIAALHRLELAETTFSDGSITLQRRKRQTWRR